VHVLRSIWYILNFLRQNRPRMETLVVGLLPRGPEDGTESAVRTVRPKNTHSAEGCRGAHVRKHTLFYCSDRYQCLHPHTPSAWLSLSLPQLLLLGPLQPKVTMS
jgi:hypothetical protein